MVHPVFPSTAILGRQPGRYSQDTHHMTIGNTLTVSSHLMRPATHPAIKPQKSFTSQGESVCHRVTSSSPALPSSTGVIPSPTQPPIKAPNTVPCLSALPRTQGAIKIQGEYKLVLCDWNL